MPAFTTAIYTKCGSPGQNNWARKRKAIQIGEGKKNHLPENISYMKKILKIPQRTLLDQQVN